MTPVQIALLALATFWLGHIFGYGCGYRRGKEAVKTALNALYGKFGVRGWAPCIQCPNHLQLKCARHGCQAIPGNVTNED